MILYLRGYTHRLSVTIRVFNSTSAQMETFVLYVEVRQILSLNPGGETDAA
jgi:hypothetical protein